MLLPDMPIIRLLRSLVRLHRLGVFENFEGKVQQACDIIDKSRNPHVHAVTVWVL